MKLPRRRPVLKQALLVLLVTAAAGAQPFVIDEGGQLNYLLVDSEAECHVILRPESRLVFAFPSENSGAAFIFGPGARLHGLEVKSTPDPTGQTVVFRARSEGPLQISRTLLGSVRTLREQIEGPGAEWVWKIQASYKGPPGFARGISKLNPGSLAYSRPYLPGGQYQAFVTWPAGVTATANRHVYKLHSARPFELNFTVRVPHPPLGGPRPEELTTPEARALTEGRAQEALRNLHFLTRGGKMLAGSWRFLTYFGRDTLLSLALLQPVLNREVLQTGLNSVLERLSPTGEVAHEEELGDWAVLRNIELGRRLPPAEMGQPLYDYKMVDDEFLLSVVCHKLLGAEAAPWLEAHRAPILANWKRVLDQAAAGPVPIMKGQDVGDWRDSREGMGWGVYSGNVNHTLVPAALLGISEMAQSWPAGRAEGERARGLLRRWEGERARYRVRLSPAQVRDRLNAYLLRLEPAEREFYLRRPLGAGTLRDFTAGGELPGGALSFLALSLTPDSQPVEVLNSDISFLLFLGNPTRDEVVESVRLLELEYPLGLMTPVGPVVANPAFSLDERHARQLGRQAYHGAVIWSWQSAMLQAGLLRQWDTYQNDAELAPRLQAVIRLLVDAEKRAGSLANAELWTHRVRDGQWEAVAFGAASGDQTESNALQLWSTVYPANLLRLRRAGF